MKPGSIIEVDAQDFLPQASVPLETFSLLRSLFSGDRKRENAAELAICTFDALKDKSFTDVAGARERLETTILEHYPKFLETLPTDHDGFYALREGEDLLEIDAMFADYVALHFGKEGQELADSIRRSEKTKEKAKDAALLRPWAQRRREFSETEKGRAIRAAEQKHADNALITYAFPSRLDGLNAWLRDISKLQHSALRLEVGDLLEERRQFVGPIDGLNGLVFSLWLGDGPVIASVDSKRNISFATVLWNSIVKTALARTKAVRLPRAMLDTLHGNRGANHIVPHNEEIEETTLTYLSKQKGNQLHLPLDVGLVRGKSGEGEIALRHLFSGIDWKAYILAWLKWLRDGGSMLGTFQWAAKPGLLRQFNLGGGARVHGETFRGIQKSFDTVLTKYGISTIVIADERGERTTFRATSPEPLINVHTRNGKLLHAVHAPLAMAGMREHQFAQAPESILSVDARRMPEAIGLVRFLRDNAQKIGKDGYVKRPLDRFLTETHTDRTRQAKDGRSFWSDTFEKFQVASREGDLAVLAIDGEGPGAIVTIEQSQTMGDIYQDLYATHERKAKEARKGAALRASKAVRKRK